MLVLLKTTNIIKIKEILDMSFAQAGGWEKKIRIMFCVRIILVLLIY